MVMTDNNSPTCRVVHSLENICTKPLVRIGTEEIHPRDSSLTCEVWITVRSFIRENPASILPRRPMPIMSDHTGLEEGMNLTCGPKLDSLPLNEISPPDDRRMVW